MGAMCAFTIDTIDLGIDFIESEVKQSKYICSTRQGDIMGNTQLFAGLALAVGIAAPVSAQDVASGRLIEEVIVTAQKREERLQDVPISISVVSADALEAFKLNETTDIQNLVPGVSLTNGAGPRSFGFFIRGIGTTSFSSESIEGSSAYVLDGVVMGQAGASLTDLPDVERVEVLRGPQGTLFGKNASAGVISLTTVRPSAEWTARGNASWAKPDDERKVSGLVSGPITDNARLLVSARLSQRDGYVDNVVDGRELNDRDEYGARAKLELTPTQNLTMMFIGDYWKRDAECCIWTLRRTSATPSVIPEQQQLAAGIVPNESNQRQNINGPVFSDTKSYGASAQVDYELGGFTLTSITAWRRWDTIDGLDSDNSPLNLLDVNFADFRQRQWTQEVRIASPVGGAVDYVAGLFYFDSHVQSESTQLFATVPLPFFRRVVNNDATTENMAVFGQANFHVTDKLTLIAGGRVLREEATADKVRRDIVLNLTDGASAEKSDDAVVWRGGVQYRFNDDVMAFATATRGYKGGGFDTNIGLGTLPNVEPEEPTSYEVGMRTTLFDKRLTANFTAFKTKVDRYQTSARDPDQAIFYIRNAEADTQGVEFDLFARPLAEQDFTLGLSGAYVDAQWGNFRNAACFQGQTAAQGCVGGVQNLTDKPLPFAPEWTFSGFTGYSRPVAGAAYRVGMNVSASYRDTTGIQFPNSPFTIQSGYALVNAALSFGASDGNWQLSLYGKNLADEEYALLMFPTPFGTPPGNISHFIPYDARRIVGLSLDVSF
jgi:iron complex outermembrane recepter protein